MILVDNVSDGGSIVLLLSSHCLKASENVNTTFFSSSSSYIIIVVFLQSQNNYISTQKVCDFGCMCYVIGFTKFSSGKWLQTIYLVIFN